MRDKTSEINIVSNHIIVIELLKQILISDIIDSCHHQQILMCSKEYHIIFHFSSQKLTNSRRGSSGSNSSGRSWFLPGGGIRSEDCQSARGNMGLIQRSRCIDGSQENLDDIPIELRHLEPDDPSLLDIPPSQAIQTCFSYMSYEQQTKELKSKSLTDLVKAAPQQISSLRKESNCSIATSADFLTSIDSLNNVIRSKSSSSCLSLSSPLSISETSAASIESVHTKDSLSSESTNGTKEVKSGSSLKSMELRSIDSGIEVQSNPVPTAVKKRPILMKQKTSINETDSPIIIEISKPETSPAPVKEPSIEQVGEKDYLNIPKGLGIIKQSSLNDEFIFPDRFMEKEKIKQGIQKQSSLNEDLIYGNKEQKHESLKDILFKAQFKRFQVIRESFEKLRTASLDRFEKERPETLKNGIVKLLQSWKSELLLGKSKSAGSREQDGNAPTGYGSTFTSKFFRRNSGSFEGDESERTSGGEKRVFTFESRERKSSREDSSDSSKENSFQSDTSIDSEDSCISVIFVPKPDQRNTSDEKERNKSVSSESSEGSDKPLSPKSPKSPKSPGNSSTSTTRHFPPGRLLGPITPAKNLQPLGQTALPCVAETCTSTESVLEPQKSPIASQKSSPFDKGLIVRSASLDKDAHKAKLIVPSSEKYRELFRQNSLNSQSIIEDVVKTVANPQSLTFNDLSKPSSSKSESLIRSTSINKGEILSLRSIDNKVPSTKKIIPHHKSDETTRTDAIKNINKSQDTTSSNVSKYIPKYEPHIMKRDPSYTQQLSSLLLGENVEIIRKPATSGARNVQIVRKTVPRYLTFEVFNPETDDLDSDNSSSSSTSSSSTHSESSVIERGWPTEKDIEELDKEIKRCEEEERLRILKQTQELVMNEEKQSSHESSIDGQKLSLVEPVHRMDTIKEEALHADAGICAKINFDLFYEMNNFDNIIFFL